MNMKNKTADIEAENIGFMALIMVGSGDRARQDLRTKLKKLDTILEKRPYDFGNIAIAGTEVLEAIENLQQKYSILEKANNI